MLPKSNRLPAIEIKKILRSGKRIGGREFQLVYAGGDAGNCRFAVIVSSAINKRAVARNRIKRLLRESVRHLITGIKPVDAVLIAKKDFSKLKQTEVELLVRDALQKSGVLNHES